MGASNVVAEVEVEALAGRRLRWWWNRFRRTLEVVVPLREDVLRDAILVVKTT